MADLVKNFSDLLGPLFEQIDKEKLMEKAIEQAKKIGKEIEENADVIVDGVKVNLKELKKEVSPVWKEFLGSFTKCEEANVKVVRTAILKKIQLLQIAKDNIVPGAKEVAACMMNKENSYIVYLTYTSNKELLPKEKNIYIIINAEAVSPDVQSLFGDSKFIILK